MKHLRSKLALPVLFFLSVFLAPVTLSPASLSDIDALAPVEVVAQGFSEPTGVAVNQDGAIFVSDRKSGKVFKIVGTAVGPIVTNLQRPVGLEFDKEGRLLIVEEKTGSLLRLETNRSLTVLAQGMEKPRWVTVAEDGTSYLSAKGLKAQGDKEDDDEDEEQGEIILRLTPSGQLTVFVNGFEGLQGIAVNKGFLFVAAKGLKKEEDDHGGVFRIPIQPDGSAGPISRLTQSEIKKPFGLVLDILGTLYVSAEEIELEKKAKDAIGKIAPSGALTRFASGLEEPRGLALDSFGNLYVADDKGDKKGRIIRFRAPPPPGLIFPSFTNQSLLTIHGTTQLQSRIDAFLNNSVTPTIFTQDGAFALILNLIPNAQNLLDVFTTAHNGLGLTSAPAEFTIVHDNIPPVISGLQLLSGSYLNTNRPRIQANFSDNLSGVDVNRVMISLDNVNVTAHASVTASGFTLDPLNPLSLPVFPLAEGSHTVSIFVQDRSGNSASASSTFTVDVTPPDTQIVSGPEGTISATSVVFTVTGGDNLTPTGSLVFSWRLDNGSFSPFSPQTQVSFTGLTPGPHTFEVKARDLAGNEDPTPATRSFTISTLEILITQPANGATVPTGSLLVRGTVEAGGVEVGITVNGFPAAVQGNGFAALVPVTPDTTSLTAVASTAAGATASHSVNINVLATPASAFILSASPRSGVAPLIVSFSSLGGATISSIELDFDGNDTVDFTGASLEGQTFTYTQPGIYVPTVVVTDTQRNLQTANAVVQVFDRTALDVMLQAKWNGMKDALRGGNINRALDPITLIARDDYQYLFTALTPQLENIDDILKNITLVSMDDGRAEYEMIRVDDGIPLSYLVLFVLDGDGIWRLKFF